jgi:hypothetical protein
VSAKWFWQSIAVENNMQLDFPKEIQLFMHWEFE